jgi:hypothetical protein
MNMLESIQGNGIVLASGAVAAFPFPVADAIEFDDVIVVRVQPPRGTIFNENVFGIQRNGRQIWQIQREYPPTEDVPWGGLENRNGEAWLSNWQSRLVWVNPNTGAVLRRGISVR